MTKLPLRFYDLVRKELILPDVTFTDRDEALTVMARMLIDYRYCKESFLQAILEREHHYPSALPMRGYNIAIPHADSHHVQKPALVFARLQQPIEFSSMGDPQKKLPVSMISMFALHEKKLVGDLLETLITVYQDEATLLEIYSAEGRDKIYRVLRDTVEQTQLRTP